MKISKLHYTAALTAVLCSTFYLLGIWQNSFHGVSNSNPISTVQISSTHIPKPLDFTGPTSPENQDPFPLCSSNLTEYTPCEDPTRSFNFPRERLIYVERHCPQKEEILNCRIPAPNGYRRTFRWPESREWVWYANVPHKHLTVDKGGQNWVQLKRDRFRFPGGGTMFRRGADGYIDQIGKFINLKDGSVRTAIDTGCGVASWGAYLMSRGIITMSIAPRDNHEAQVQFALERGVPALLGIFASIRLPFPSRSFDLAHCSRCLIPWHLYEAQYLHRLDRILRPGGYWVLSGPPINWKTHWKSWKLKSADDLKSEQETIESIARNLCWEKLVEKDDIAIWRKPFNHIHCKINNPIPFCQTHDPDSAWYTKMERCITPLPETDDRVKWPERLTAIPGGITEKIFREENEKWKKRLVYYKRHDSQLGEKGRYRNLLDMNSFLGGFAGSMIDDPVWVMNVVPVEVTNFVSSNTLGIIYERGLIGTYQNWCEAMSSYPRTYDFIHADSVFSLYKGRCRMEDIMLEMDRLLRPEGSVIIRDSGDILIHVKTFADRLEWDNMILDSEEGPLDQNRLMFATKINKQQNLGRTRKSGSS
ncbi:probable methyltransferase PMT15 [Impatiens glandulifera]|uniref:probable methyltransferase PMT15 n=1 Tax=Impatiens glandulifera TaxID=253017 RepID=UPI001FB13776|nr:probable methyltransferase PMT15 [Impatiens glandulifera]